MSCQLLNLETEVRPYLSRWFEESVMHIYRVVQLVQSNISFLLHAVSYYSIILYKNCVLERGLGN